MQNIRDYLSSKNQALDLILIFEALALAAKTMQETLSQASFLHLLGDNSSTNIQDEMQQKLDDYADILFESALKNTQKIAALVSEERIEMTSLEKNAPYIVAMDPLDGSSNIDVNVNVGSIFAIFNRKTPIGHSPDLSDALQKGKEQIAAAYILYGSATLLVLTIGEGTLGFTLHKDGNFYLTHHFKMPMPTIYSINEAQAADWDENTKQQITAYKKTCTARYIGSLVADFHRNLLKGGAYFYPATSKFPNGKLRLLYECAPLAFLAEQAGAGAYIEKNTKISELIPTHIHQRTPFLVGFLE
jgi:fructose-1,6-bisphosphatase I